MGRESDKSSRKQGVYRGRSKKTDGTVRGGFTGGGTGKPSSLSWLYIFGAVLLIFGLTLVFQQMSGTADGEVRPADIESLQAEIAELKGTVSDLEARIEALENE